MRKPYQSPGRMKNSSYYIAPVGDWTHDLPHTVASNMVKVSHALNHSATEAVYTKYTITFINNNIWVTKLPFSVVLDTELKWANQNSDERLAYNITWIQVTYDQHSDTGDMTEYRWRDVITWARVT